MLSKELQKMLDNAVEIKTTIFKELKPLRLKEDKLQKELDKIAAELRTTSAGTSLGKSAGGRRKACYWPVAS